MSQSIGKIPYFCILFLEPYPMNYFKKHFDALIIFTGGGVWLCFRTIIHVFPLTFIFIFMLNILMILLHKEYGGLRAPLSSSCGGLRRPVRPPAGGAFHPQLFFLASAGAGGPNRPPALELSAP